MQKILRTPDLLQITGLSRTTIWRLERAGDFPRRLRLGPNAVGWDAAEVEGWLASRPRGLDGSAAGQAAQDAV